MKIKMKITCKICGRMVGITKGKMVKHRVGRSTPTKVQSVCTGSGFSWKFNKVEVPNNRKARRAAMFAAKKEALEKVVSKKVKA